MAITHHTLVPHLLGIGRLPLLQFSHHLIQLLRMLPSKMQHSILLQVQCFCQSLCCEIRGALSERKKRHNT